jgi:hypothetical protein
MENPLTKTRLIGHYARFAPAGLSILGVVPGRVYRGSTSAESTRLPYFQINMKSQIRRPCEGQKTLQFILERWITHNKNPKLSSRK